MRAGTDWPRMPISMSVPIALDSRRDIGHPNIFLQTGRWTAAGYTSRLAPIIRPDIRRGRCACRAFRIRPACVESRFHFCRARTFAAEKRTLVEFADPAEAGFEGRGLRRSHDRTDTFPLRAAACSAHQGRRESSRRIHPRRAGRSIASQRIADRSRFRIRPRPCSRSERSGTRPR